MDQQPPQGPPQQDAQSESQPITMITKVALPTWKEKLKKKAWNAAGIHLISMAIGAGGGYVAGTYAQQYSREATGFSPVENAQKIKELESKKVPYQKQVEEEERKRKQSLWQSIKDKLSKSTEAIRNPEEYIKNTETFRTVYYEYLRGKEVLDKATFWIPQILMLLMLWKFSSGVITKLRGDVVRKDIDERLVAKINELVANQNEINAVMADLREIIIAVRNGTPLTIEQAVQIEQTVQQIEAIIPPPDDLEQIVAAALRDDSLTPEQAKKIPDIIKYLEDNPLSSKQLETVFKQHSENPASAESQPAAPSESDEQPLPEPAPTSTPAPKKPPVIDLSKW